MSKRPAQSLMANGWAEKKKRFAFNTKKVELLMKSVEGTSMD
jgi:hypothetical protein